MKRRGKHWERTRKTRRSRWIGWKTASPCSAVLAAARSVFPYPTTTGFACAPPRKAPRDATSRPSSRGTEKPGSAFWGKQREKLVDQLVDGGDGLDCAGTRLWAVMETAKKASGQVPANIEIQKRADGTVLFSAELPGQTLPVLTFSLTLTRGPHRVFSFAAKEGPMAETPESKFQAAFGQLFSVKSFETVEAIAPQGQGAFILRFPVSFKANAQLSRKVYFSNYFFWLGKVRGKSVHGRFWERSPSSSPPENGDW